MDSYFFRFLLRGLVQPGWTFSRVGNRLANQQGLSGKTERRTGASACLALLVKRLEILTGAGPTTVKNAIEKAAQQGTDVVIDARRVAISAADRCCRGKP